MRGGIVRGFGGPGVISVEDVPTPPIGENQVLIKVKASSVNKLDAIIRNGEFPDPPQLPYITGRDGAGIVEQVSPEVTQFKSGDRVFFVSSKNGANADYVHVDPNFVFHLPNRINFAQGATLGIAYFAAYRALFVKAFAQAGQSVLVHGASGGVGVAACQIAKVHGLRVFGTVGSDAGEKVAKEQGHCEQVWNHNSEGYVEQILQQHPGGFNVILEMVAHTNLNNDIKLLAAQGRAVVVGSKGAIEINPTDAMTKEACIVGLCTDDTNAGEYQRVAERLVGLLEGGHITPFVGRKYPLEQLPDAHAQIEGSGAQGKIVIIHDPDAEESAEAGQQPQEPVQPTEGGDASQEGPEPSQEQPEPGQEGHEAGDANEQPQDPAALDQPLPDSEPLPPQPEA